MKLSSQEAEQFYNIWWPLLLYVNSKCSISDVFNEQVENNEVLAPTVAPIREKLWSDPSLLASYISDNPANLSVEDLDIAASWKHRIAGDFFVYKYLVKHTIFIDDKEPPHAYGVHGIVSPIEDVLISPLPALVTTVLLPFKDKIIYDGLMLQSNAFFGSGYGRNLNLAYRNAKEGEGIITSLIPQNIALTPEQNKKSFLDRNNIILKAFSKDLSKSGLSAKMVLQHTSNIEVFSSTLLNFDPPRLLLDIDDIKLMDYFDKILIDLKERKINAISFKRFIRFLTVTDRLHPDDYWTMVGLLKSYKE